MRGQAVTRLLNGLARSRVLRFKLGLSTIADLSTIAALGVAVYAILNPGTVSNYFEQIRDFSRQSGETLSEIEDSSAAVRDNTELLASAIPEAATISAAYNVRTMGSGEGKILSEIIIENPTPSDMQEVEVIFIANGEGVTSAPFTIPPLQEQKLTIPYKVETFCVQYNVLRGNVRVWLSDMRVFEQDFAPAPDRIGGINTFGGILRDYELALGKCAQAQDNQ